MREKWERAKDRVSKNKMGKTAREKLHAAKKEPRKFSPWKVPEIPTWLRPIAIAN